MSGGGLMVSTDSAGVTTLLSRVTAQVALQASTGVKSIQRGTITMTALETTDTATITAVGTRAYLGFGGYTSDSLTPGAESCDQILTNTTTVTVNRAIANGDSVVPYQVIDVYVAGV